MEIVPLLAGGRDELTEPDVHLQGRADVAERAGEPHPQAALRLVDPDGVDAECAGVEENAVVEAGHGAHGLDCVADPGVIGSGEEVHIGGRRRLLFCPHAEENCALERDRCISSDTGGRYRNRSAT